MSRLTEAERFGVLRRLVPASVPNITVAMAFGEIAAMPWPRVAEAVQRFQGVELPPTPPPPLVLLGQGDYARGWTPPL